MYNVTTSKSRTVCFSGHRPQKLPDGGSNNSPVIRAIKSLVYKAVADCIEDGCNCFITGVAKGVDLWAGEIVLEHKACGKNIKLVAAFPYKGHGASFRGTEKWILGNITQYADEIVYVSDDYSDSCMKARNEYMINRSGKLIAVVGDYKSGTGQTIRLAEKNGLDIVTINSSVIDQVAKKYSDTPLNII
ncbi:MAG: DUF1273 domain-containing protein [Oscillospiraceae bacterium]|nr:DUF1273 domain-containing protein [Oscillospiraceae bacterium]